MFSVNIHFNMICNFCWFLWLVEVCCCRRHRPLSSVFVVAVSVFITWTPFLYWLPYFNDTETDTHQDTRHTQYWKSVLNRCCVICNERPYDIYSILSAHVYVYECVCVCVSVYDCKCGLCGMRFAAYFGLTTVECLHVVKSIALSLFLFCSRILHITFEVRATTDTKW